MRANVSEEEYKATLSQWQEFLKSSIWFDLQLFLADKIEAQQDLLVMTFEERQRSKEFAETDDMLRGRIREAYDLLNAPETIAQEMAEREENEKPA